MARPISVSAVGLLMAALLVPATVAAQEQINSIDYSKGNSHLPGLFGPFKPKYVPLPDLNNSVRLEDLIHDGQLHLSLQDAIYLALENNLDIAVQRYGPAIAQTDLMRSKGGGITRGAQGVGTAASLGGGATSLDPVVTSTLQLRHSQFPVSNPITSGIGTSVGLASFSQNTGTANFQYSQGFTTGTSFAITINNSRQTTSSLFDFFNPAVNSSLGIQVSQPLLNGFGFAQNKRFIRVAKNNLKISDQFFAQQVMDVVSTVKRGYWELIFANEDVKVKEQSLALAEKLYNDNRRQVEIGTLAPIEVVRAEAEVARTRQDLIVSQTNLLQGQIIMKDLVSKNPTDPLLAMVGINPTDSPQVPDVPEVLPIQDAVQIAMEKRPEIAQSQLDLQNQSLQVKATRMSMLPTVTAFGFYTGRGLAGIGGVVDPTTGTRNVVIQNGLGTSLTQAIQRDFPDYGFGLSISIPIRNRVAQAEMARAQIQERQAQTRYRRSVNTIIVEVRNAQIALDQNRARIDAAVKARELAQETLDAEQKKFQLGASTIFLVIQAQRDLAQARSNEVRSLVDFERARVDFDRSLGRTLERSSITLDDAKSGAITAGRSSRVTGSVN